MTEYSNIYNDNSNWRFYTDPSGHSVGRLATSIGENSTTILQSWRKYHQSS